MMYTCSSFNATPLATKIPTDKCRVKYRTNSRNFDKYVTELPRGNLPDVGITPLYLRKNLSNNVMIYFLVREIISTFKIQIIIT